MYNYIHSIPGGKKSRNGKMYYEEFKTEFWWKPETEYDRMHRVNQAAQAIFSLSSAASFAYYDLALIDSNQGDQGKEDEERCFVDNEEVDNEGEEISLRRGCTDSIFNINHVANFLCVTII
ncbi:hypothetical protein C1646_777406 [Rhizophagus diaphanus]|nr:hypothetical protein C1646_777406 [Rhizophagus diaphanus] [Rhizophagus sp. MUCL 43196]